MNPNYRNRRNQLIREAEGYLDLIMVFDDRWPLDIENKIAMSDRALELLCQITPDMGMKSHVYYLRGQALRLSNRFDLAITNLKRSLDINSQNIHGLLALGWCYKRIGQLSLAIEALEAALEINCENAVVHYNLACYWALANQPNLSVFHLSAALDLNQNLRDHISDEPDFDLIRHRAEFMAAANVIA